LEFPREFAAAIGAGKWRPREPVEPLHNLLHNLGLGQLTRGIIGDFFDAER
jgi:hypothetical protein